MHLFEIVGRRCDASRVRPIKYERAEIFDGITIYFIRVSHDAEFQCIEFEGAQRQRHYRLLVRMSLLHISREESLENMNFTSGLYIRDSAYRIYNSLPIFQ